MCTMVISLANIPVYVTMRYDVLNFEIVMSFWNCIVLRLDRPKKYSLGKQESINVVPEICEKQLAISCNDEK